MTSLEARTRVKLKFGIPTSTTTFDDDIDAAVSAAIDLLAPYFTGVPTLTSGASDSLDSGETTYDWGYGDPQKIWVRTSSTDTWRLVTDWSYIPSTVNTDGIIVFYEDLGDVNMRVLYAGEYQLSTIEYIPRPVTIALIDFACSEFASMLAGNKAHFNAFMQTAGARAVDSMTDLSNFYEARAMTRAQQIADADGTL